VISSRPSLPNFAKLPRLATVSTMNVSLPEELKDFVDEQVKRGYGTSSEYVRELIRKDQDRLRFRELLLAGARSAPGASADAGYFKKLRSQLRKRRASPRR
jgi:antitoxin ParD1/3/4